MAQQHPPSLVLLLKGKAGGASPAAAQHLLRAPCGMTKLGKTRAQLVAGVKMSNIRWLDERWLSNGPFWADCGKKDALFCLAGLELWSIMKKTPWKPWKPRHGFGAGSSAVPSSKTRRAQPWKWCCKSQSFTCEWPCQEFLHFGINHWKMYFCKFKCVNCTDREVSFQMFSILHCPAFSLWASVDLMDNFSVLWKYKV